MKKLICLCTLCLIASCTLPLLEEIDDNTNDTQRSVRVLTRSTSDISYPLTFYAFSMEDGTLVSSYTQPTEADELSLPLPVGNYFMVAVAGAKGYEIPSTPTLASIITTPSNGKLTEPLQMGSAAVQITQNTTVSITLYNQVAAIELSLYDIPTDATTVSTSFSLMSSGVSFDGKYSGNATITVDLAKEDEMWTTPLFYILPNNGERLTLSITTTTPSGIQTYGYTHSSPLKANTPYTLKGSFTDGFTVNGTISLAGWNKAETISFTFGGEDNGNDTPAIPENPNEVYEVTTLPEVGSLWNGHFVVGALDIDDPDIIPMLLLSLSEWTGVTSATHEETPDMAAEIAAAYTEGDLTGWRIPTRREVNKMCATLGYITLEETNTFLSTNGIVPLSTGTESETKNTIRYLCDDAAFSFTWDSEGSPSKAGSKRGYHLRLVNSVRFRVIE